MQAATETKPTFELGEVYMTPGAIEAIQDSGELFLIFLARHRCLEQGELSQEDHSENLLSAKEGFRVFSSFKTAKGEKIWVITEADRTSTTLLLPTEY
jgi:hypothetical protein